MPTSVTEKWSAQELQKSGDGWTAQRAWDVYGPTREIDALNAVPAQLNSTHPQAARLRVRGLSASRPGFSLWEVRADYAEGQASGDEDPTKRKLKIKWDNGNESVPIDIDATGIPILGSTGFPFDQQPTGTVFSKFLTVSRYEPFWSVQKLFYEGTVCSNTFTITGIGPVQAGQMACLTIGPESEYEVGESPLLISYRFECRAGAKKDPDGLFDSFKTRIIDASFMGWALVDGVLMTGRFCNEKRDVIDEPTLLNGSGRPLDGNTYVLIDGDPKIPVNKNVISPMLLEKTGKATFLKFRKFRPADFRGLQL